MKKMNNKGFSLVELIVVIAIMAVLVGVLAPQFIKYVENSRRSTDISTAESIRSAILADIADQEGNFADDSNGDATPINVSGDNRPSSISEDPAMKSTDYKGDAFKAAWNAGDGTCDVYTSDEAFILTDVNGAAAYKNQKDAPNIGDGSDDQHKTVS